jgi:serine O-acetyltransferase
MKLSLTKSELAAYVARQLEGLFPDGAGLGDAPRFVAGALERLERCFAAIGVKGYRDAEGPRFSHRHTDQYAVFLYYLANTAHRLAPGHPVAEKAYALNKALHALDAFYEVELPDVLLLVHPIGTVLGRATYGDYFCAYHNCTVGANLDSASPELGRGVVLYSGARVVGRTSVGANTFVSTGAIVRDAGRLADDRVVFGVSPHTGVRPTRRSVLRDVFQLPQS